jgi:hypothetical protein
MPPPPPRATIPIPSISPTRQAGPNAGEVESTAGAGGTSPPHHVGLFVLPYRVHPTTNFHSKAPSTQERGVPPPRAIIPATSPGPNAHVAWPSPTSRQLQFCLHNAPRLGSSKRALRLHSGTVSCCGQPTARSADWVEREGGEGPPPRNPIRCAASCHASRCCSGSSLARGRAWRSVDGRGKCEPWFTFSVAVAASIMR